MDNLPLISVITPVYNGADFLPECIESVLSQTYANFEYIIVNNCSTDATLEIAQSYAKTDNRVRVYSNEKFVGVIENHNIAFRKISANSKYCKVVSSDDLIFPDCLSQLASIAELYPSVGIVGSYQLSGGGPDWSQWRVRWDEVPYPHPVIMGREICRTRLLGGPYVFGTPTSLLYRSDLVMEQQSFYPNSTAEADTSACYQCLKSTDFGFVHQVLSYERVHQIRVTTTSQLRNAYLGSNIGDILTYGPLYLTKAEIDSRLHQLLESYYAFLAGSILNFRDQEFWGYHRARLKELGYPLDNLRLCKALALKLMDLLLNPKETVEKILNRLNPSKGKHSALPSGTQTQAEQAIRIPNLPGSQVHFEQVSGSR